MRLLTLLMFLLMVSCTTTKPKPPEPPPIPPFVEFCGDSICGPGETQINCPEDCKPDAPPPPTGPPKPVIKRDHSRTVALGVYSYAAQSNVDHEQFFKNLPLNINAVRIFGISGWLNYKSFYPWPCDQIKKTCDQSKLNDAYFQFQRDLFRTAAKYDVKIIWCFFTKYASSGQWAKYANKGYGSLVTPYCNSKNQDWCQSSQGLYANWKRTGFAASDYHWLQWKTAPPPAPDDTVVSVVGVGKNGPGNIAYVRKTADQVQQVRKEWSNFSFWWQPFNEEPETWEEDHRIENWIMKEFADRGFKMSAQYRVLENSEAGIQSENVSAWNIGLIKANQKWVIARGNRIYEVHNCSAFNGKHLLANGLIAANLMCSADALSDAGMNTEAGLLLNAKELKHIEIKTNGLETDTGKDMNVILKKSNEWATRYVK